MGYAVVVGSTARELRQPLPEIEPLTMTHIEVKLHDVLHDPRPDNPHLSMSDIETRLEQHPPSTAITDVQILTGHRNSPILITLEATTLTFDRIKRAAEQVVRKFAEYHNGVDIDKTVRDDNIRIQTPTS